MSVVKNFIINKSKVDGNPKLVPFNRFFFSKENLQ